WVEGPVKKAENQPAGGTGGHGNSGLELQGVPPPETRGLWAGVRGEDREEGAEAGGGWWGAGGAVGGGGKGRDRAPGAAGPGRGGRPAPGRVPGRGRPALVPAGGDQRTRRGP